MIILRMSPRGRGRQTPRASQGGHPMLREEDIPRSSYACNFFLAKVARCVTDTSRHRAVVTDSEITQQCVSDTLRDIAQCAMDTSRHRVVEAGRHPCFARRTPRASRGGHSVIILRVSPRGRGGQTPVLREEDTPCFARRTFRDHLTRVTAW